MPHLPAVAPKCWAHACACTPPGIIGLWHVLVRQSHHRLSSVASPPPTPIAGAKLNGQNLVGIS